ncbi:hypothetical protein [Streptococcus sp. DD12]|uniref:hypothetical protein n=1 Tax=Streptococcus sp. DD12 TaxID=1777880 RepID=UPI000836E42B|nr:hypothetical protein [Streptococcus sp. DD12]
MKYSDLASLLSGAGQFLIGLASLLAIIRPKKKNLTEIHAGLSKIPNKVREATPAPYLSIS